MNGAFHFTVLAVARANIKPDGNRAVFSFVLFPLDMHCCSSHDDSYNVTSIMATTGTKTTLQKNQKAFLIDLTDALAKWGVSLSRP